MIDGLFKDLTEGFRWWFRVLGLTPRPTPRFDIEACRLANVKAEYLRGLITLEEMEQEIERCLRGYAPVLRGGVAVVGGISAAEATARFAAFSAAAQKAYLAK